MQNLKDINWNHLYGFYEVAKLQSLKEGARVLGIVPSTLSEQLKKLEQEFQKKLFKRSARGLLLTSEGQQLFEHTKLIFEEGNRVLEKFFENEIGGYPVRVGVEEAVSDDLLSDFISQYWDFYAPFGTVSTSRQRGHEILLENLYEKQIDWGVTAVAPQRRDIRNAVIGSFELVFCCAKELFEKFKNARDLLANIPLAQSRWDSQLNSLCDNYLRKHGVLPKEIITSDHPAFVRKLCERGRCVMFIPKNPLKRYRGLKTFVLNESLKLTLYATWKSEDEELVSIKRLKELIETQLSQLPARYDDVDFQIEASDVPKNLLV